MSDAREFDEEAGYRAFVRWLEEPDEPITLMALFRHALDRLHCALVLSLLVTLLLVWLLLVMPLCWLLDRLGVPCPFE